jgi:hypothetical protein
MRACMMRESRAGLITRRAPCEELVHPVVNSEA